VEHYVRFCSLDTKSTLIAASSISVIKLKHRKLKIGDRSLSNKSHREKKKKQKSFESAALMTANCSYKSLKGNSIP